MKKHSIFIGLSILLLISCNSKEGNIKPFSLEEFIEEHSNLAKNELNTKLDSVLKNNQEINKNEKAYIFFEKGKNYSHLFKDKLAKENYLKAEQLFEQADNIEYRIKSLINLSNTNIYLKNYVEGNSQAIMALDLAKSNSKNKLIASANNTISRLYYINKDYEKSFEYLNNSAQLQIKEKDSFNLAVTYNNIAILYKNINVVEKSIEYNYKSLAISEATKDSIGIGKTFSNLGRLYGSIEDNDKALKYYKKAIKNNTEANILNSIPYGNIGELHLGQELFDSSIVYYEKAKEIEKIKKNPNRLLLIYNDLFEIATYQKQPSEIFKYQKKKDSLNFEIKAQENREKLKVLKKQEKAFQVEKENEHIKAINNRNRILFISIFMILLLLGIILFQKIRNSNLKYKEQKNSLELKVLRSQMNPHFIFNALSAIQNSILDNDTIKSATYLSRFAKLIRQNFDFVNHKTISLEDEIDALKNYLDTQKMRFQDKFNYTISISENIDVNLQEIPPLLLQPFVENSIEHGFKSKKEKGLITINIFKKDNTLNFEIKDNGNGINTSKINSKTHSTDIFKKRLKLLGNKDELSFKTTSSGKGTIIKFGLKQ